MRIKPYLAEGAVLSALAMVTIIFFWKIALTNLILVGLDVFTFFYPYKAYAAEMVRQGHLPLWNPYLFMGAPFLADIQTALLYPLNFPLYWLPAPKMVSCSILVHVFLAALFAYLFARVSVGMNRYGSLIAALVFAGSGFLGAQVEHVNQLNVSVWLPLLFLFLDLAQRRRGMKYALLLSLVVGLQFTAGHIQASYINLFALGLYALWPVVRKVWRRGKGGELRGLRELGLEALRGVGLYALAVALGVGLAAAQLLPTYELAQHSFRGGGLPYDLAASFSLDPRLMPLSLLPNFGGTLFSEYVSYVGIFPLLLALLGALFRRDNRRAPFFLFLCFLGLFLALGGYNPFYFLLYKLVPGFSLFRAPARWLYLYTLAAAILAGLGADFLARPGPEKAASLGQEINGLPNLVQRRTLKTLAIVLAPFVTASPFLKLPSLGILALWLGLGGLGLAFLLLGWRWWGRVFYLVVLALVVVVELFAASRHLPYNRPTAPEAYSSLRTAVTHLLTDQSLYRFIGMSDLSFDPGDLPEIEQIFARQLPKEAIYDYVVATKRKELLVPNLSLLYRVPSVDGYGGGILPLRRWVDGMQGLLLPAGEVSPDGRLWQRLMEVPEGRWLDLFNVKYVIADKVHDVWVDGVYYDLGHGAQLSQASPEVVLTDSPPFSTTSVGLISYLTGSAGISQGTAIAEVIVADVEGDVRRYTLRAGVDTAEGEYDLVTAQHQQVRVVRHWRDNPQGNDYHALIDLGGVVSPQKIVVRYLWPEGRLHLRGVSLIDDRTGTFQPLIVSTHGWFKLVHSGDVKIYENLDHLPRAFVVHRARVIEDDEAVIAAMRDASFVPQDEVILCEGQALAAPAQGADEVEVISYEPERIVIEADLASDGYLVLTDVYYPGWRAWIDGREEGIRRADYLFRAVYLPQGEHVVEFAYDPLSFKAGILISLATLFVVGLGVASQIRRSKPLRLPSGAGAGTAPTRQEGASGV